jgi:hypothetical protein
MVLQRRAGVKKYTIAQYLMAGGMVGGVLFAGTASAIDWNITGFVRQEIAYSGPVSIFVCEAFG